MGKELRIFIASSKYYAEKNSDGEIDDAKSRNGKLKRVIEAIEQAGYEAMPWWCDPNFKNGRTPLQSLIVASKQYDGGVFILNKDLELAIDSDKGLPNFNVILEAGMFYASKGIDKTFLIADGSYENIYIPSDLVGYNIPSLNQGDLKNRIINFFKPLGNPTSSSFDKVTYYISDYLSQQVADGDYKKWETKGLYIGNKSARIWNEIENSHSYEVNINALRNFLDEIVQDNQINFRQIDNVVSFGCGNGETDNWILQKIAETNNAIGYIPIDINPILVFYASKNIDKTIRLPFSIVDDFEIEVEHIHRVLHEKRFEIGERNLFIMLGVTFSNLEGNESSVFNKIKKWLEPGDYFLMDASISKGDDIHSLKRAIQNQNYKKLLYNSLLKKGIIDYNKSMDEIDFTLNGIIDNMRYKYTEIESTKVYSYDYKDHRILVSKRYHFKDIVEKIELNFDLIGSKIVNSQSNRDKAFFLFKNL